MFINHLLDLKEAFYVLENVIIFPTIKLKYNGKTVFDRMNLFINFDVSLVYVFSIASLVTVSNV